MESQTVPAPTQSQSQQQQCKQRHQEEQLQLPSQPQQQQQQQQQQQPQQSQVQHMQSQSKDVQNNKQQPQQQKQNDNNSRHNQQQQQQQQKQQQQMSKLQRQLANIDSSWVCVLCHKICHYRGLGDLFGPYNIDFSNDECKSITPKKSKYSLLNHNYAVKEIWIHEDCLVWSEGVHLVGKKILRMEEIIKASLNNNCSNCQTKGATIGCVGHRCRRKYHYTCARDANCMLDDANFTLKCDKCLANTAANRSFSMNF